MKCCTQAKLALPSGGVPYFQRGSSASFAFHQSLTLNGGFARTKSARRSGWRSCVKVVSGLVSEVGVDAAQGEVHLRELPGRRR